MCPLAIQEDHCILTRLQDFIYAGILLNGYKMGIKDTKHLTQLNTCGHHMFVRKILHFCQNQDLDGPNTKELLPPHLKGIKIPNYRVIQIILPEIIHICHTLAQTL